jgi:hypothetical protein
MENEHRAFLAWTSHYNGQGELLKHMAMAKARIKSLFYKNKHSLSFEKVMEILSKKMSTLDKDSGKRYSECQKVEKLLLCIQMPDMEVVAQKSVIASQYANDFSAACNYFSAQISHLHGRAQLENSKYTKKHNVSVMYGRGGQDDGRGGGCGRFSGRGRFGGRGGGHSGRQGGEGSDRSNYINGIDESDLTQNFMDEEWRKLAYNGGWLYVAQAQEQMNSQGQGGCNGCGHQNDGHSGGCWNDNGGGHNIGAVGTDCNDIG